MTNPQWDRKDLKNYKIIFTSKRGSYYCEMVTFKLQESWAVFYFLWLVETAMLVLSKKTKSSEATIYS